MILRTLILLSFLATAPGLRAQDDDDGRDRTLEEMEARLQEQRATALRARLITYTDELDKLHARFNAAGETVAAALVKTELDSVAAAMRQLAGIARRQADPPAPGELKEDEEISAPDLAARRIDQIVARFAAAKGSARPSASSLAAAPARPRVLKFDKSRRSSTYDYLEGRAYWAYESSYAQWSLSDLTPGEYEVILRYADDAGTGGKAIIKAGAVTLEVTVPKGGKNARDQKLSAGTLTIKEPGVDVRVENGGLAGKADALWNLDSIVLQPAAAKRP